MPANPNEHCKDCKNFEPTDSTCHFNPPIAYVQPAAPAPVVTSTYAPVKDREAGWCAQFKKLTP
jgi:hypothetical protein